MSRTRYRFANLLAAITLVLTVIGVLIILLTLDDPPRGGWGLRGFTAPFAIICGSIGWLIMVRRPENRIGLVLAALGVESAAQLVLPEYAALASRNGLPAANLAGWVGSFVWVIAVALFAGFIPLLFPDGRLPSPRWRPVAWLLGVPSVVLILITALDPDVLDTPRFVERVIRVPVSDATLNSLAYVVFGVFGLGIVAAGASVVMRWRRATGLVREQLKWLALSVGLIATTLPLALVPNVFANAAFIVAGISVPVAVGIAVLRYRLYEIDMVISRTLVFGLLTALLTGLFAGLQRLFQGIFVGVTGNESDAAIVITTLVLAASFAPMKSGLEKLVSRRFAPPKEATPAAEPLAAAVPAELETLLRRIVREEIRAAFVETTAPLDSSPVTTPAEAS
jgi:hypothetical protein